jgi:predicted dehydrogenase
LNRSGLFCDNQSISTESENNFTSDNKISVAVIGAGAFGRNHARVYSELQQQGAVELAAIVDSDAVRAQAVAKAFGTKAFASIDAMLREAKPQAASVAVPTVHHAAVACELMEAGVDVLIEKPVAPSLADADQILRTAKRCNRVAQVGHLERFNPAVRATVPLITKPMFFEVHRLSVFTPRALDVDVVLDLMIHDLDIVLSFVTSPVKEIRAVGLPILSGKVDIANVRMEFESGCVANFTASRVSTEKVRKLRFFQPREYISIDYSRQDVFALKVDSAAVAAAMMSGTVAPEQLGSLISPRKPAVKQEEPLLAELCSFLDSVRQRSKPLVSVEEGTRALGAALDVLAKIDEHNRRIQVEAAWPAKN